MCLIATMVQTSKHVALKVMEVKICKLNQVLSYISELLIIQNARLCLDFRLIIYSKHIMIMHINPHTHHEQQ